MWNQITLIGQTETVDAYGDHVIVETERDVLAEDYSVGMTEIYQAMTLGFKPEVKLRLTNWLDYQGEEFVEYTPFGWAYPIRFKILRTFRSGEALELTCYRTVQKPVDPTPPAPEPGPTPAPSGSDEPAPEEK